MNQLDFKVFLLHKTFEVTEIAKFNLTVGASPMTELSSVLIGVGRWLSRIAANVLPTKDKSRSGLNSTPQRVEGLVGVESKAQSGLQYCPLYCNIAILPPLPD